MKRPLWVIGVSYALTLLIALMLGWKAAIWLAVMSLLAFFMALWFPFLRRRRAVLAALLTAAAAFSVGVVTDLTPTGEELDGQTRHWQLRVLEPEEDSCLAEVIDSADEAGLRVRVWLGSEEPIPAKGAILEGDFQLCADSDGSSWNRAEPVRLIAFAQPGTAPAVSDAPQESVAVRLEQRRLSLRRIVDRYLPGEEGKLVRAVCLGDKSGLSTAVVADFRAAGLSHLLAVSGFHTMIVAQALLAFLRKCRVPHRLAAGLAAMGVVGFVWLTGASPSAMRAGVMCLVLLLAQVLSRDADSRNSLGLALLILVVPQPTAVFDIGLQFSFTAALGLIVLYPWLRRKAAAWWQRRTSRAAPRPLKAVVELLLVTLAATLPLLPLLAIHFGELSLVSPLANLLAVFPTTLLLVCGGLGTLFGGWASSLARGCFLATGLIAKYLLAITAWIGGLPWATASVREPYLLVWLAGALLLLVLGYYLLGIKGLWRGAGISALVLLVSLCLHTGWMRGVTTVTTLATDNQLALLLEREGHAALLVSGDKPSLLETVGYELEERGIRRLDFLLLAGADPGCATGLPAFVERVKTERLLCPADSAGAWAAEALPPEDMPYHPGEVFGFWSDSRVTCLPNGVQLELGNTRVLVSLDAAIVTDWIDVDAVVTMGTALPPSVSAEEGIVSADTVRMMKLADTLPWGRYPIRITASHGDVRRMTRGNGDWQS